MAKKPKNYVVGYGRPPIHSRFKPGKSPNPSGRPKRNLTTEDLFAAEFKKVVVVQTPEGPLRIKKGELLIQQFVNLALKGSPKPLFASLEMLDNIQKRAGKSAIKTAQLQFDRDMIAGMTQQDLSDLYRKLINDSHGRDAPDDEDN
jgi:Family of unknown function (DUF5681)